MINTAYIDLNNFFGERILDVVNRKKATSMAVGVAVAMLLPLPTAEVEDSVYQYNSFNVHLAVSYISEFNENIVIDIDLARDTARSFWLMRYSAVYPNLDVPFTPKGACTFSEKLFSTPLFVSPVVLEYLNKNSEVMVVLVNRIKILFKNIKPAAEVV
jgi:hypothetical protein